MKAFLRFLSFLFLVAAVFLGVLDSVRSVSTSSVNITGILSVWNYLLPASRTMVEAAMAHYIHPEAWRFVENALSTVPAFAVSLALSLLCWMAGYRKHKAMRRLSA
ncbi:hypothetical protein [Agrobacterium tumefaciens]|jgi:hypothetical protein|uniref:hypothetical protein n=1 Tax=Agrobacterium tumefaciens TaxID=358 RepID=UPI0004598508|nr:hypothetical protein [Agrobacterium tumefaciens]TQN56594.1 hypothetical protein FLX27_28565 [Agrobacterium tumefaciens]UXS32983.1 hypothetical protein FY152_13085 [Agrobacterium tumefaciens]CDN92098.1 hypothetical protein BN949_01239 [Agrobacterium tumefaciens]